MSVRFVQLVFIGSALLSCNDGARLPYYNAGKSESGSSQSGATSCATPKEGCPCSQPGESIACGEVTSKVDSYVACTEGNRLCTGSTWGKCTGKTAIATSVNGPLKQAQGLGASHDCTAANPCDPLCREIVDTGAGLTGLQANVCSTALGIESCSMCGYQRPTTNLAYDQLPVDWQTQPTTCSPTADSCTFDTHCVGTQCAGWTEPCRNPDATCDVDLTVGKPCVGLLSPDGSYHIPICNRGTVRADTGTIRVGFDSRAAAASTGFRALNGFPDTAYVTYGLATSTDSFIDPGTCIDINPSNSDMSGTLSSGQTLAVVVNYASEVTECNGDNNTNVLVSTAEPSGGSVCAECSGLACNQTNSNTSLSGYVYDPAGRTVLPNVTIYVPNSEVAQLVNASSATCDTCESLISGSPVAITTTDTSGAFTLRNVPTGVEFPLIIQTGRWRRQVSVAAIPSGATRWINECAANGSLTGNSSADCTVTADLQDASTAGLHLRLPRTQRRCSGTNCAGEGDIPKMALIMGDADPLQCLLRRIGLAESELTSAAESGQIHLFNHNGMQITGGQPAFGSGGLLGNADQLMGYAALLAPCDYAHNRVRGQFYSNSWYRSGPSYNSPPDPTASDSERANVREYLDSGGRLFATHWMSLDFVHLNYSPPESADFAANPPVPILSPSDPDSNPSFAASIATISPPGFEWNYVSLDAYNTDAPVVHLFGRNLESVGNTTEPVPPAFNPVYPHFDYTIDNSAGNKLGQDLAAWATVVGASPSGEPGKLRFHSWSPIVRAVRAELGVTRLAYGDARDEGSYYYAGIKPPRVPSPQAPCLSTGNAATPNGCRNPTSAYWGDEHVALFQFDTPLQSADKCGRVVVAESHVTKHACRMPSVAPSACPTNGTSSDCSCVQLPDASEWARGCGDSADNLAPLQPEELAFEYLLFSTTQCLGNVSLPPSAVTLPNVKFRRLFQADCARGELPVWQVFSLQATIPSGAAVRVSARTADTESALTASNWISLPDFVDSTTTWTSSDHTMDWYFRNDLQPRDVSRTWLEVVMELRPNGSVSPTLSQWRAIYNCTPSE